MLTFLYQVVLPTCICLSTINRIFSDVARRPGCEHMKTIIFSWILLLTKMHVNRQRMYLGEFTIFFRVYKLNRPCCLVAFSVPLFSLKRPESSLCGHGWYAWDVSAVVGCRCRCCCRRCCCCCCCCCCWRYLQVGKTKELVGVVKEQPYVSTEGASFQVPGSHHGSLGGGRQRGASRMSLGVVHNGMGWKGALLKPAERGFFAKQKQKKNGSRKGGSSNFGYWDFSGFFWKIYDTKYSRMQSSYQCVC